MKHHVQVGRYDVTIEGCIARVVDRSTGELEELEGREPGHALELAVAWCRDERLLETEGAAIGSKVEELGSGPALLRSESVEEVA